jgi:hypothetical protein
MIDIKLAAKGKVAGMGENILCGVKFRAQQPRIHSPQIHRLHRFCDCITICVIVRTPKAIKICESVVDNYLM